MAAPAATTRIQNEDVEGRTKNARKELKARSETTATAI
jgi:hypothetical protein